MVEGPGRVKPGRTTAWLVTATAAGLVAAFVSLLAAGAGHGTNVPAYLLVPWTMLLASSQTDSIMLLALSVAPFPLYAALAAWRRWLVAPIAFGHAVASLWLLVDNGYLF